MNKLFIASSLEIWISEMKLQEDGITLMSYQNIDDGIVYLGEDG